MPRGDLQTPSGACVKARDAERSAMSRQSATPAWEYGGAWLDGLLPKLVHCQQRFNELASDRHPGERDCVVIQKCSVQIPRDQVLLPPFLKGDRGGF